MSEWVNFKELRSHLNFKDVFRFYGIELKAKKPNQHVGSCPLPKHQGKPDAACFSANLEKGIFQCFVCKAKGNVLDFCAFKEGFDATQPDELRKAALVIRQKFFGIESEAKPKPKAQSEQLPLLSGQSVKINEPLPFTLKGLDFSHPYLRGRKFTAETITAFGLGFCTRGSLAGRIAIPLHDSQGKLIGYAGRLTDDSAVSEENPKYRLPGPREREGTIYEFRESEFLYNGHRIKAPVENLIVVEGFPALWWLVQAGFWNTVALMGADCSDTQGKLLCSLLLPYGCCHIFTDGNVAGARGAAEVFAKVAPHRFVRRVPLPDGKQPTDFAPEELEVLLHECKGGAVAAKKSGRSISVRLLTKEIRRPQAIVELMRSFPSLQGYGTTWDADALDEAACHFQGMQRFAAQFVLEVWSAERDWKCGTFTVARATDMWDAAHRKAFLSWVSDPW